MWEKKDRTNFEFLISALKSIESNGLFGPSLENFKKNQKSFTVSDNEKFSYFVSLRIK